MQTIIETAFTPFQALGGGALIGLASVLLMAGYGRILGATGIMAGVLHPTSKADWTWRVAILLGMMTGPLVFWMFSGAMPAIQVPISTPMMIIGGILVGIGVTFGSGCTSGHGVCGLARLSSRSLVATLTFMATGVATVFIIRHILGA